MTATAAYDIKLVTGPAVEPITIDEAKLHLRVDAFEDDYTINSLVKCARQYVEIVTGLALITQTWDQYLQDWPCNGEIILRRSPLISVASVNVKDTAGTETAVASTVYIVDANQDPPRIVEAYGQTWPSTTLYPASPIRIRFTAGHGATAASVPEPLRAAMLLLIGHWFKFREAVLAGNMERLSQELPIGVAHLRANYRMYA